MSFTGATKDRVHTRGHLVGAEQTVGLGHLALAMDPGGLNRIEPWTLDRQGTAEDADADAGLLDLAVVGAQPRADRDAAMPGGIVPDQEQGLVAGGLELVDAPAQELDGQGADGAAVDT